TLAENTDGRPQSRSPATAQREARRHSALLSPASYTISWGTINLRFLALIIHTHNNLAGRR
ncbi:hypothetical protein DTW90_35390, partial [Neorhizobium sp. P12A]